MNRLHRILIALLVIQLVLGGIAFWPRSAPASAVGEPLLKDIAAEDIVGLTIHDDTDVSIELSRVAGSGEAGWGLVDAEAYPVDGSKVTPLLDKLLAIKQSRLVTTTSASHKRLQVATNDFLRKIDLKTTDGKTRTLFLGSSAGMQAIHVRLEGEDEVYQAGDLAVWDFGTGPTAWIDPVYLSVNQAGVTEMTLRNANGEWTFSKDADGNWTMQGLAPDETLNSNNVVGLLSRVSSVRMKRPLGKSETPDYGMAQPNAVVTLKVKETDQLISQTLTIGAKDEGDQSYVVKSSRSDYYVSIAEATAMDLVERTRDEFLQPPPTPMPEATPSP